MVISYQDLTRGDENSTIYIAYISLRAILEQHKHVFLQQQQQQKKKYQQII